MDNRTNGSRLVHCRPAEGVGGGDHGESGENGGFPDCRIAEGVDGGNFGKISAEKRPASGIKSSSSTHTNSDPY